MKVDKLKLNFLDNYCMFYDWLETDKVEIVTGLKLYKVSGSVISDFINYKFKLTNLDLLSKNNYLVFSDGYNYIAIEFSKDGKSLYKSSLLLSDEIRLSKKIDSIKKTKCEYEIISEDKRIFDLRINDEIRKTIKVELNTIKSNNDLDKLKYLYYEWFNKNESDFDKMLHCMIKKIDLPVTEKEKYIYGLIKKSYKFV